MDFNIAHYEKLKHSLKVQFGKLQISLGNGDYLGEIALLKPMQKRTATVVCHTDTEFMVLLRKDFEMIRDGMEEEKQEQRKFILKTMPGCSSINSS